MSFFTLYPLHGSFILFLLLAIIIHLKLIVYRKLTCMQISCFIIYNIGTLNNAYCTYIQFKYYPYTVFILLIAAWVMGQVEFPVTYIACESHELLFKSPEQKKLVDKLIIIIIITYNIRGSNQRSSLLTRAYFS